MKKISSLLAAFICFAMMTSLSAQQTVWHKQLRVNPKPVVAMSSATVCENDSIDIYFTGRIDDNITPGQHKFTLTYTIDVANNPTFNGTDVLPATVGFPTVFSLTPSVGEGQLIYVSGPDNVTAASTYYARIAANVPGEFTFKLDGVQDDKCYNDTNKTVIITVLPKPAIAIDTTGANICFNGQRIFTFSAAEAPYMLYYHNGANDLTLTSADGSAQTVTFNTVGIYNFVFDSVTTQNGCTAKIGNGVNDIKLHVTAGNLDIISWNTTVHGLPTADIVETDICQADTATLVFHGKPIFSIPDLAITPSAGLPNSFAQSILTDAGNADDAGDKDWSIKIAGNDAGNFAFAGTLTDAWGCTNTVSDAINVRPLPTVAFENVDEICEDDAITLTFTGSVPTFTMDYKLTIAPNQALPADLVTPTSIGLPTTFTTIVTAAPATNNGTTFTYTIDIVGGKAGLFDFYVKSLTNNGCTITNPTGDYY